MIMDRHWARLANVTPLYERPLSDKSPRVFVLTDGTEGTASQIFRSPRNVNRIRLRTIQQRLQRGWLDPENLYGKTNRMD